MDAPGLTIAAHEHSGARDALPAGRDPEAAALHDELTRTRRELLATRELTAVMHASPDTGGVQQRVLQLVTGELGYEQAVLARHDPHLGELTGWDVLTAPPGGCGRDTLHPAARLPLIEGSGPVARAALAEEPALLPEGETPTTDPVLNACLGTVSRAVLPLVLRGQLLGVLLVGNPISRRPITGDDLSLLANIARQASLVLGSLQLCIDRAQRTAIEEERGRIAMEIHDTVSQHLYGIGYTLDASVRLLPEHAAEVRERLTYLQPQVQAANSAIRQIIFDLWPEEFDAERFTEQVRAYAREMSSGDGPELEVVVDPHFDTLPAAARKQIYLIVQEALSNTIKHAGATRSSVRFDWSPVELCLRVRDNGRGLGNDEHESRPAAKGHYGVQGMRERAQSLGGTFKVTGTPGEGTEVVVTAPVGY